MPIKTRQMFTQQPDLQAAEYQLALARAMQQQSMRPNVPQNGGPVQATYGVGQGLVDLATALTSAYNVKKSEAAYKRAQEAQAAQAQAQQRQALDAMLGGQNAGDGMGPPTPTPGYEQTIGMSQRAHDAGVNPALISALLEARKPKEKEAGYTLAAGARRFGPEGQMVAENPAVAGAAGSGFGNVNPGDYTPASLARYAQTRNYRDLVRQYAPASPYIGMIGGGLTAITDPRNPGAQMQLSTPEQERAAAAAAAGEKARSEVVARNQGELSATLDADLAKIDDEIARTNRILGEFKGGKYQTGPMAGMLPNWRTASQELAREQGKDVIKAISSATFGALSEGEREFLKNIGISEKNTEEANVSLLEQRATDLQRTRDRLAKRGVAAMQPTSAPTAPSNGPIVVDW